MIATGADHSVFLRNDNTVWGFGYNNKGQLGNNSTANSGLAVQVRKSTTATDYLTGCVSVAAGTGFTIAAHSGGQVYAWGDQELGRLGNGSVAVGSRLYAGVVYQGTGSTPLSGIKWVAAGGASALGLNTTTGKVWAWGQNSTGQLGQGTSGNNLIRAATVKQASGTDLADVTDIACGGDHSAFVRWKTGDPNLQGRVYCVGKQQYGRLGDNVTSASTNRVWADQAVLKAVGVPLENVVQVAAGPAFTLALDSSGKVWAWGRNQYGALGRGNTTNSALAVAVKKPDGTGQLGGITRIAAGGFQDTATTPNHQSFALAVATDGTVYAWGYNGNGQLGNGSTSTTPVTLPTAVTGLDLSTYPDVTLACDVTQAGIPGSVTLKASPVDPDNNITKVEFFQQGVSVGEATSAPWEIPVNNLAQGTYHNYAVVTDASGYKGYSTPVYFDITWPPPVVTLSTTVNTGVAPGSVTLTAVPSDPNHAITKVEFFSQETLLGERAGAPWTMDLTNLVAGNYMVSAKVTNSVGQVGASATSHFLIAANSSDLALDVDGDGLSAAAENLLGTSDLDPDSDGDGVPDNIDGTPRLPNRQDFTSSSLMVTSPLR